MCVCARSATPSPRHTRMRSCGSLANISQRASGRPLALRRLVSAEQLPRAGTQEGAGAADARQALSASLPPMGVGSPAIPQSLNIGR